MHWISVLSPFGLADVFAVRLGDDHQVGHLHDAAFDALQFVAGSGNLEQHEEVYHGVDGRFALSYADGFDEYRVEAGRFAEDDRLA